ncbi:hypothetical protein PVNG_02842 [Plasmodium vivax North Korean]|uniref:Uncharacterized protein n=1 Tax=Plasmodium vivax North Korean TaxID=1035514 RepID=A0A0J9W649_PLAVI|nr:hypothetical protein PVNG_02842 [Plasmodium vivax North Korean]
MNTFNFAFINICFNLHIYNKISFHSQFEFFEGIDSRIKIEEELIEKAQSAEDVTCKSLESSGIPKKVINNKVCEQFKYFYKSLCTGENKECNKNDYAFLNFWLNNILYSYEKSDQIDANVYFQKLKDKDRDFDKGDNLKSSIYKINNDTLDNMNIIYNLYRIYRNIYDGKDVVCIEHTQCLNYYNKIVEEYKKGLIKCPNYATNFCKSLGLFNIIITRNKVNLLLSNKFTLSDSLDLPTYAEIAKELGIYDGKEITLLIFSIVGPIFGIITLWIYLKKVKKFY